MIWTKPNPQKRKGRGRGREREQFVHNFIHLFTHQKQRKLQTFLSPFLFQDCKFEESVPWNRGSLSSPLKPSPQNRPFLYLFCLSVFQSLKLCSSGCKALENLLLTSAA
ncbi:hypothetical protein YC2023_089641 [Brassica napus]